MGKKLIITNADFSQNGIYNDPNDLTELFVFENGAFDYDGSERGSAAVRRSNIVDISVYAGRTMNISWCDYIAANGSQPQYYGLFFMDLNGDIISSSRIPIGTGSNGKGDCVDKNLTIPSNAVSFKTIYLNSDYFNGEPIPFYCRIIPNSEI
jgi:hypothetical protein